MLLGCPMRIVRLSLVIVAALVASQFAPSTAGAMPMFARKYKLPCTACHDSLAYPRLNDVGYKFRRAGFRMPENIGKDELTDFSMTDYNSMKVEADNTTNVDRKAGTTDSSNTFGGDMELHVMTGSFQKYFASEAELDFAPGNGAAFNNADVRAVYGDEDLWFVARAGVFHPFEGLGASDRFLGPSRPLMFGLVPRQNQSTLVSLAPTRTGIDVGVQWKNTSLSVEVVNRAHLVASDGAISANATSEDAGGGKDLIVVANQILGTRSGLSAYWAHGQIGLPTEVMAFAAGTSPATWNNQYDKLAVFASGGWKELLFLGGAELGFDHALDVGPGTTTRFTSVGGFVEAELAILPYAVGYVRADYVDPSTSVGSNQVYAGTLGVLFNENYVSLTPELQIRRLTDETDTTFVIHAAVIY